MNAHEIWSAAQLAPGEGIEDGVARIEALIQAQTAAAQAREKLLLLALEALVEEVARPPDRNCSCHISPPCGDCVDYGGLREAFEWVDMALAQPTDDTALNDALKKESGRIIYQHVGRDYQDLDPEEALSVWTDNMRQHERDRCSEKVRRITGINGITKSEYTLALAVAANEIDALGD